MPKVFEIYDRLNHPAQEAFRTLRTNLKFSQLSEKYKTLSIVSFGQKEGKTTVAINLAISFARSGKKVLLVDADMRKPDFIKRLVDSSVKGFSDLLVNNLPIQEVISYTSLNKLYYISCGAKPQNPSELISSPMFKQFLQKAAEQFDIVIIDTSSLGVVIDGAIISSQTDATLIVIKSRSTSAGKVKRLKEQLEKANANIIGAVINNINKSDYKTYGHDQGNAVYFDQKTQPMKIYRKKMDKGVNAANHD